MVIRYSDGSYVEGVIYRLQGGTVRAAVAGVDDVIEYRLVREQWTSELGVVVTFEFTLGLEKGMDRFQIMPPQIMPAQIVPDQIMPASIGEAEVRCAAGGECVIRRISGSVTRRVN